MFNALHRNTPTLTAIDPRGLAVRTVQYHRATPADSPQPRVNRQVFGASGFLLEQWDPRQFALGSAGAATQSNLYSLSGETVRTQNADAGRRLVLCGSAGQRLHSWDSRGAHQAFGYDRSLRPVQVSEQAQEDLSPRCVERMTYATATPAEAVGNRCGRLIRHADPAGVLLVEAYGIDQRIIKQTRRFRAGIELVDWPQSDEAQDLLVERQAYTTTWRYDALGSLLEQNDAKGNRQHWRYGRQGWSLEVALTLKNGERQVLMDQRTYNASGQIVSERAGNDVTKVARFSEQEGRLLELKVYRKGQAAAPLQQLVYEYDPVGNILSLSDLAQPTQWHSNARIDAVSRYEYDTLYQLIQASGRENSASTGGQKLPAAVQFGATDQGLWRNYTQYYSYDEAGNLTRLRHVPSSGTGYTRDMQVAALTNRAVPAVKGQQVQWDEVFDANGNQLSLDGVQQAAWNVRNQLTYTTQVQRENGDPDGESYLYDSQGLRALKVRRREARTKPYTQETCYLPGLQLHKQGTQRFNMLDIDTGGGRVTVVQWESGKPSEMSTHQLRFSVLDHLKSCALELDEQARLLSQEHYYPYGATAWWATSNIVRGHHKVRRYSDKERDATGLYYYGARYYAPWLQRWISPDPLGDVDGLNLYAMVRGNPVRFRDADGTQTTFGEQFQPGRGDIIFGLAATITAYRSFWSKLSARGDAMVAYFSGAELQRWTAGLAPPVHAFAAFRNANAELFSDLTQDPHDPARANELKAELIEQISVGVRPFYEGIVLKYSGCTSTACNQQFARRFVGDLTAGKYSLEATARQTIGKSLLDIQQKIVTRSSKSALETLTSSHSAAVIHFALDNLDIGAVISKQGSKRGSEHGVSATASELRWLYRHRTQLAGRVLFYQNQQRVDAPWESNASAWDRYKPRRPRGAGRAAR
ncbi:RHS repeat-associated core domain-containing protein [Pseudomonas orientalis]|uniref:RHS repeat-associated core domain-containing protein n=1 Tax=Pseudomonas orientalis TaxID=76758 RepID=UPI00197F111E|nr:RHS repeat-associated core domain-containing protein [Pseudomonas orientalis]